MNRRWAWGIALVASAAAVAAQSSTTPRTFSLAGQIGIELDMRWSERRDAEPPPLPALLASTPKLAVSDILILENHAARSVAQLALSDNPFVGRDAPSLDAQFHAQPGTGRGFHEHLFYFFFPPPKACVERARQEFERRQREQELNAERDTDGKLKKPLPAITVSRACSFSPALLEMYAEQVSGGVTFTQAEKQERVRGELREFYLPPMEAIELGGRTFFVFEAQGQRLIERTEIEKYGLPEDWRGARAHFFWAVGAPTPFPFLKDALRKDVQLVHVVYACLSVDGNARKEFHGLLRRVR